MTIVIILWTVILLMLTNTGIKVTSAFNTISNYPTFSTKITTAPNNNNNIIGYHHHKKTFTLRGMTSGEGVESSKEKTLFEKTASDTMDDDPPRSAKQIYIVGVTCNSAIESSTLRSGVVELFKLYFDELFDLGCDLGFQGFQSEWTDLPGKYDFKKRGALYVAVEVEVPMDDVSAPRTIFVPPGGDLPKDSSFDHGCSQVVGCIALRELTQTCGEVKRMYIRKSHRRLGIGKLLARAIMDRAWDKSDDGISLGGTKCNYEEVKLDSLERLEGAVKLYENIGFNRIPPYCECPEDDHVCMNIFKS